VRPVPTIATARSEPSPSGKHVHRFGRSDRELRIAPARRAEVRHDTLPEQGLIGARADFVDDSGDLSAGRHRQPGQRRGAAGLATADQGVEQVHTRGLRLDADGAFARVRVGQLLGPQLVGASEGVLSDREHRHQLPAGVPASDGCADAPTPVECSSRSAWRSAHATIAAAIAAG
jgi:hypothetical protein